MIRKKLTALLLVTAMVLSLAATASANTNSKYVDGYGTLKGVLTPTEVTTTVTTNTDSAALSDTVSRYNASGKLINSFRSISKAGAVYFSGNPGDSYDTVTWRCVHAVQGGMRYRGDSVETVAYR